MTRRILLSGLFFIGALNGSAEHTTLAYLTTAVRSTANSFSAGTLHIADSLAAGTTLSMDNLVAGDSFDAQLNVDNHGSLSLAYGLSTSIAGSSALANALDLTVRAKTANPCAARDGSVLYTGPLATATFGNPAHGVQLGDRVLAGGASEALCFTIELPATTSDTSETLSGTNATATFVLSAEQAT